jgi:hypothetical protein
MLGFTRKELIHGAMALGTGAGVFLAYTSEIVSNAYVQAGCFAGIATLTALGVGIARRSS